MLHVALAERRAPDALKSVDGGCASGATYTSAARVFPRDRCHAEHPLLGHVVRRAVQPIGRGIGQQKQTLALPLQRMDELYALTASRNAEVRLRWQRLCLKLRAEFIVPEVIDFLKSQGRMKFVRPLYRDLYAWEQTRETATSTFQSWAENYHPIARKMLAQDLKLG